MHNCERMRYNVIEDIDEYISSDKVIYYDKSEDTYYLINSFSGDCIPLDYCPWCGEKLNNRGTEKKNIFAIYNHRSKEYSCYSPNDKDEDEKAFYKNIRELFERNKHV